MKRFLLVCLLLISTVIPALAKEGLIKFNGNKFVLRYKSENKLTNGFLNEYLKPAEKFESWSEMIAIHTLPNETSYSKQIGEFKKYLDSVNADYNISEYTGKNSPTIDFIIVSSKKYPTIVEFNIFRYEKEIEKGLLAIQYAKRYTVKTAMEVDSVKEEIKKEKSRLLKCVQNFDYPEIIITEEAQKIFEEKDRYERDVTVYLMNENSVDYFIKPSISPRLIKVEDANSLDVYFTRYLQYDKRFIIDREVEYIKEDHVREFFNMGL